jgi:hypothetical protein
MAGKRHHHRIGCQAAGFLPACPHDPDPSVRGLAALCLGYVLRFHGSLDVQRVLPILERLLEDENVAPRTDEALDEISREGNAFLLYPHPNLGHGT